MKIQTDCQTVESSADLTRTPLRIQASQKAFEILSSGLYSDKIAAVIRELATNAADSHQAAQQSQPFQVHLPTQLEPFFSVKDFGTGLSPQAVEGLYTTYFDSDRTDSNDFTGCFGLGSKSPFAFTDQFAVESRFNGEHSVYSLFIDEHHLPCLTCLSRQPTDESNGLEVKFPVAPSYFAEFKTKAEIILQWFQPLPKVSPSDITPRTVNYVKRTTLYALPRYACASRLVMGNVAYPLTARDIPELSNESRQLLDHGLDLFLPVDRVPEIAASREKLSYTPATRAKLAAVMLIVLEELRQDATHLLDGAKTIWGARTLLHDLRPTMLGKLMPTVSHWQGQMICEYVKAEEYSLTPLIEHMRFKSRYSKSRSSRIMRSRTNEMVAGTIPILLNDLPRGGYAIAAHYLHTNGTHREAYLLSPKYTLIDPMDTRPDFASSGALELAIKLSTLAKPPPVSREETTKRTTLQKWQRGRTEPWCPVTVSLKQGGIYVVIHRGLLALMPGAPWEDKTQACRLNLYMDPLRVLGVAPPELYGVRPVDEARLTAANGWQALPEYIQQLLTQSRQPLEQVRLAEQWRNLRYNNALLSFAKMTSKLAPIELTAISTLTNFLAEVYVAGLLAKEPAVEAYETLAFSFAKYAQATTNPLEEYRRRVWQQYPMFAHVDWQAAQDFFIELLAYVRLLEQHKPVAKQVDALAICS